MSGIDPFQLQQRKAKLKKEIVRFLDTQFPMKKCWLKHFWNQLSVFMQMTLSHKHYNVSKLSNLLEEFQDVVYCDHKYVYLRQTQRSEAVVISDNDSDDFYDDCVENTNVNSCSSASNPSKKMRPESKGRMPQWGAGAGMIPTPEGTPGTAKGPYNIEISSESESDDGIEVTCNQTKPSSTASSSGFIGFNDAPPSRENQGQASFQRYGLAKNSPGITATGESAALPPAQLMAQNFMSQFARVQTATPQVGAIPPLMPQQPQQQQLLHIQQQRQLQHLQQQQHQQQLQQQQHQQQLQQQQLQQQQLQQQQQQLQQQQQQQQQHLAHGAPTTGAAVPPPMAMAPPPQPVASEWPQQPPKTGPPPGTKITESIPDVIIRPIRLAPGTRLTAAQVNSEIETCRELLSDAGEHVSMERVQSLVLQKFQVRDFRMLNLRERQFDNMPAARDLSMLIGKLNAYIHNFVRSRSMCTLYELQDCCREFHSEKKSFEHLKIGPLQKMPLIYDLFKFPHDEYIPEITTLDLMEHLNQYLSKYQRWTAKNTIDEFMQYLIEEAYQVESGFSLGIRLRSLPLAIQTMKKAQRDSAGTRRHIMENLKDVLNKDIYQALAQFRASLLQTNDEGKHELRLHYMSLNPEVAIREVFTKFELLSHVFLTDAHMSRKIERVQRAFQSFVATVLEVPIPRMLYHLSVCLSNLEVHESATEFLQQEQQQQQQQDQARLAVQKQREQDKKSTPPTKAKLVEKMLVYVNKCLDSGHLQLSHLMSIEAKLLDDFQFETFSEMGYGKFLGLLLKEPKLSAVLEDCGGTMLGSSTKGHGFESAYKPSQWEVQELLCQANHAGLTEPQQMESVLCEQYRVADIKLLGHGSNVGRLWHTAQTSRKHASRAQSVHFEAALCGKLGRSTNARQGQVGVLGSQTREAAEACLTLCPLLEDLAVWSQWGLVFQPQFGPLREFVDKYGGHRDIPVKGKPGTTASSDFMALEVAPGQLLKICPFSSVEQFVSALETGEPRLAAGHLASLIVTNKGVEGTPLALLANHLKTRLLALHAQSAMLAMPGAPPSLEQTKSVDLAVQFVTEMLLRIPLRICVAVAEQVLLKPLSEVVGSDKSKAQVAQACRTRTQDLHRLEQLGCLLGISEWWSSSLPAKMEFPPEYCVTEALSRNEDLFGPTGQDEEDDEEEESREDDSDDSDVESDVDALLTAEEDNVEDGEEKTSTAGSTKESASTAAKEDSTSKDDRAGETSNNNKVEDSSDDNDENDSEGGSDSDEDEDDVDKTDKEKAETSGRQKAITEDENVDEVGKSMEKILAVSDKTRELTREEVCHKIVDEIRRDEFGVGIELGETEQKLMLKQQERQGRSLERLSKDLYSKDTHFVLELIQNADDNSYPQDVTPAVKFVIDGSGVKVMNNESGFEAKNIRALCDVGKSTKTKHTLGYIGQKGIGFKSVFRVTGRPEVHSNGFHICFDKDSGPMGYILPHWIEASSIADESQAWKTLIALPWTEEIKQQLHTHAARFNDIKPSLLLFLHRLRHITIDNTVDGLQTSMLRTDLGDGEIQIVHSGITDRWLVVRKVLDASNVSMQMKAGVEVDSTEIALAFPMREKNVVQQAQMKPPMLPVFAFLPLRTYGFRFIIQGDFDVPSSREDVDRDSSWNQWLRSEIHTLFIEALEAFKKRPDLSPLEALIQYLQFVPLEDEVVDFFKPVTTHILAQLRGSKCLPVLTGDKKGIAWKLPSQCVLTHDPLVREVVSPALLKHRLDLYYLHPQVAICLDQPLADVLLVQPISTAHLLSIGGFIAQNWSGQGDPDQVMEVAKWLACVYRSLGEFQTIEELNSLRVIPLADGTLVALEDATVFLLTDESRASAKKNNARDPLAQLRGDLDLVHPALTSTPDNEINSQVVKLLLRSGAVKQLTAHDLVHSHIMPVLSSDKWKTKSREVIISYLVYIKSELDRQPSLIETSELRSSVKLVTNHGIHSPEEKSIHFSMAFGNKIDLRGTFPGVQWTLVDSAYLPSKPTAADVQSWHNFLGTLGVVDFLRVKRVEITFDKDSMDETPWAAYKKLWPNSPDGYAITDFECEEFHQLVKLAEVATDNGEGSPEFAAALTQMGALFELVDSQWASEYSRFTPTQLRSGSGHVLREAIETSFAMHLKSLAWIPTDWAEVTSVENGRSAVVSQRRGLCRGSDVFVDIADVRTRLAHTVKYLTATAQRSSRFVDFLGIRCRVSPEEVTAAYISWCKRNPDKPNIPAIFCTTKTHILELYRLFNYELSGRAAQDVFHDHPAIFVPQVGPGDGAWTRGQQVVVGRMMSREEVWWCDPTGLLSKYHESLCNFNSPLGRRSLLQPFYGQHSAEFFKSLVRPDWVPSTIHLAELLKHIASAKTLHEDGVLADTLFLFSHIGERLAKVDDQEAGVPTYAASLAKTEMRPVVSMLSEAGVFPSHHLEWVNPSQQLLVRPDSKQLEELFTSKPGVHFLLTELPKNVSSLAGKNCSPLDKQSVQHFVGLFEAIKPLSECVTTQEITSGFKQSISGQVYLHKVVALIQRFLYFVFPTIYKAVRPGRAEALKRMIFVEVQQLEAKYELVGHPEISVISKERCMVQDNMFYLHREFVSSQSDINREIAKYFSQGDKTCVRELVSFLTQAVPILEGKSPESMGSLLARQQVEVGELPDTEEVWEVPLPVIQEPEPEPEPEEVYEGEAQMVYGRSLDSMPGKDSNTSSGETSEGPALKSWPPRSNAMMTDEEQARPKKAEGEAKSSPAGMWPPPRPPNSSRSARALPSNIRVKVEDGDDNQSESGDSRAGGSSAGGGVSRQTSHSSEVGGGGTSKSHDSRQGTAVGGVADGRPRAPRDDECDEDGDKDDEKRVRGDGSQHQSRRDGDGREKPGGADVLSGEKHPTSECKRKASDGSRDGERALPKRINSKVDETSDEEGHGRSQDGGNREGRSGVKGQGPGREVDSESSGTYVTASSSNESQDSHMKPVKQRKNLHFTIPLWSEANQDLEYTDLSKVITSDLPSLDLEGDALGHEDAMKVGRWGEMLVLDYLLKLKSSEAAIEAVLWANADGEKGLPWDFEVVYAGAHGLDDCRTVYIEVKATMAMGKEAFEVSPRQLELALKEGPNFQVYRVFGAGRQEPRLVRVDNVADRLHSKQLKLYMLL